MKVNYTKKNFLNPLFDAIRKYDIIKITISQHGLFFLRIFYLYIYEHFVRVEEYKEEI